ncbi:MAG: long-chain fatty acid--CoA ligase [Planctomycetaceae bacterium]|nr:long-chain fatty acid--CoA ligase [Planctomycetaceae bacterium]
MDGLMMEVPLTLDMILRRAETIHTEREVVTRLTDKEWHRYSYGEMANRAKRLTLALRGLGVKPGDRVATLCWNHYRHLEAYFGIPIGGAVLHTLNLRLHPDELAYIVNQAQDKILIVDESLLGILAEFREQIQPEQIIVIRESDADLSNEWLDYELLLADVDVADYQQVELDESSAAAMCYTSGTVGQPKGVVYSHRAITLHTLGAALTSGLEIWEQDCILPVVPMFHVNAWGLPYVAAMMGSKLVLAGQHVDAISLLEAFEQEQVTMTAGVPTIWIGLLQELDANPQQYDLSALRKLIVGGASLAKSLIQAFEERHQLRLVQAWGMTETTPIGTVSLLREGQDQAVQDQQYEWRARQGTPVAFVEVRARADAGLVPWDGSTMGELEVRGPWIARAYYQRADTADRFTDDGWFRTGDIVSIDAKGCVKIEDRLKDLIKSGGEWISSQDLENTLLAHPSVLEAAVVAIPDEKWSERPLAVVVLHPDQQVTADQLRDHLRDKVAKWWLPERFEFVESLPKTSVGKIKKSALREIYS